jgi:hypothetical protein
VGSVLVVHHDHHAAGAKIGQRAENVGKRGSIMRG